MSGVPKAAGSSPENSDDKAEDVISKKDHERILDDKLKGQGKQIKELEAWKAEREKEDQERKRKVDERKQQALIKEGEHLKVIEQKDQRIAELERENAELKGENTQYRDAEGKRKARVNEENEERIKTLAEAGEVVIPDVIKDDPYAVRDYLNSVESARGASDDDEEPERVRDIRDGPGRKTQNSKGKKKSLAERLHERRAGGAR